MPHLYTSLGLMSGTSMDGIDAAVIQTDGKEQITPKSFLHVPYEKTFREKLRRCLGHPKKDPEIEQELTKLHIQICKQLIEETGLVHCIGFHGHTIYHAPQEKKTVQIGDGALLAQATGIEVINDFRQQDVENGGQGAPFAPLYHAARASNLPKPLAIVNIGGVANITFLGSDNTILAFDTGPGNALIDDWIEQNTEHTFDLDGRIAAKGIVLQEELKKFLCLPYFTKPSPKSIDRNEFNNIDLPSCSVEDGAATLTAFTADSIIKAAEHLPEKPTQWIFTGGGRHNVTLMERLKKKIPVLLAEEIGWNGDALEAKAFAYLAVRSKLGLPLSLPSTTGIPYPLTGGVSHCPPR